MITEAQAGAAVACEIPTASATTTTTAPAPVAARVPIRKPASRRPPARPARPASRRRGIRPGPLGRCALRPEPRDHPGPDMGSFSYFQAVPGVKGAFFLPSVLQNPGKLPATTYAA